MTRTAGTVAGSTGADEGGAAGSPGPGVTGARSFDPKAQGWEIQADEGFLGFVGPIWERQAEGRTRYGFVADDRHRNLLNVVQGGMVMTFADRAMGLEAWRAAGGRRCVTVQFSVQFVASVPIGEFVETEPRVVRATKSVVFLDATLEAGSRIVATAQGVWKVLYL